jgi:hypothetical protein
MRGRVTDAADGNHDERVVQIRRSQRHVRRRPYLWPVSESACELSDLSNELLHRERGVLLEGIADVTRRAALHRRLLEQLELELCAQTRLLSEIEELMDLRPQLRLERLDRQLRGRRLQEVAVEILRSRAADHRPVHYREWFAYLRAEGYEVAGRDPLATFLTQISRADGVERVGARRGLYRLA